MKNRLIWIMAAVLSLTACSEQDNPISDPDEPGKKDYAERLVPVVDPQGKAQGMVTLRFYDDMPNVAYVSIGNFQGIVYPGTTVQVAKTAPDRYLLTSPCGTATVDTANDRFESDDYEAFTNMMGLVQPGMPNTIFDALPMLRWKSIEKTPNNVHVTLDYGKYGIDLRADQLPWLFRAVGPGAERPEGEGFGQSPAGLRQGRTNDTPAAAVGKHVRLYGWHRHTESAVCKYAHRRDNV